MTVAVGREGARGRASETSSDAARADERAVSGRVAPGTATTSGARARSQARAASSAVTPCALRDLGEDGMTSQPCDAARPSEGRVGDEGDAELDTALEDAAAKRAVVDDAESCLHRRHGRKRERLVELVAS